jgi:two-component system C4-dicarboxylate transport sensor histidine kinase DctB
MEKYIRLMVFKFDNNKMVIECEDSGEGISDDNSPGIFVPFHSTKGEYGMGIGLYWVDRLVKNMGGSIEVINKNELGGATFKLILPLNYKIIEL